MGKKIEEIASGRGHQIVLRIDEHTRDWNMKEAELAIDFSTPETAFEHIRRSIDKGVPVVSGTTGWLQRWEEAVSHCRANGGALLYASNFSLGVNLFFELNRRLAGLMAGHRDYRVYMEETHHIHKKDSPSGTAISLAEDIEKTSGDYRGWTLLNGPTDEGRNASSNGSPRTVPIRSFREGEVPGIHAVQYRSDVDLIRIEHEAFNRDGFALGAVIAGEWLLGKTGVFSMKDVLGL